LVGVEVDLGGEVVDANATEPPGSELIGLGVAVIVLLLAFGSVIAMGIPLLTAVFGLGIGLSLIQRAQAQLVGGDPRHDDRARRRHRLRAVRCLAPFLHEGMTVVESAARANATAGSAVVFAGATVVIAILGLQIAGLPMVTSMGLAAAIRVAVMVLVSVVLLPALLAIVGHRIDRLTVPGMKPKVDTVGRRSLGGRWAAAVSARPLLSASLGAGLLLLLTVPLLDLRLGLTDAGSSPISTTERRAYDLLSEGFGPGFNGPLVVAVDLDGAAPSLLAELSVALAADPDITGVGPAITNESGDTAVITAFPSSQPQDAETTDLVHRLRRTTIPSVIGASGGAAYVTGSTAWTSRCPS
jgi:putative drug exporter of the RND superfamily